MSERNIYEKHGMYGSPEYRSWYAMKNRCRNPNASNYPHYGGRGISYHPRWESFTNFYADMGSRPKGSSLDRINNDEDYGPDNCRWATPREQRANQRIPTTNKTGIAGVYFDGERGKWAAYISVEGKRRNLYWGTSFLNACAARLSAENEATEVVL